MNKLPISEKEIQQSVIQYLTLKGWKCLRLNSGAIHLKTGLNNSRWIKMSEAGTPDVYCMRPAIWKGQKIPFTETYFLEIKRPGKKPTKIQMEKMEELRRYGATCLVVHDLDELREAGL